jgi:hypothetical protein
VGKAVEKFWEGVQAGADQQQSLSAMQALGQGLKTAIGSYAGALVDVVYSQEMKEFAAHGAHEAASAIFNGSAFVMYPRSAHSREDPQPTHGLGDAKAAPEQQQSQGMGY